VSFDVVSLFAKISVPEALDLVSKLVDPETFNLIKICLTPTFFTFKGTCYEQTEGTTMGSSLSPVVANIFMEHFEALALNNFQLKPKCWYRFEDDTFEVWPHGRPALNSFFDNLNIISPQIQFTIEIQTYNSLPFLDVLVSRQPDGTLTHEVYRKMNHTDRYLHAHSHHHPAKNSSVLKTLISRALRISTPRVLKNEKSHLTKALVANGYSIAQINKALCSALRPKSKPPLLLLPLCLHWSLFPTSKALLITSLCCWLKRISKLFLNPIKPLNNCSDRS
jgi:hypothetical protein